MVLTLILILVGLVPTLRGQCTSDLQVRLASYNCTCDEEETQNVVLCINSHLQSIPQDLPQPVQGLHMQGNDLDTVTSLPYPGLSTLLLQDNNITKLAKGVFIGLSQLLTLSLANNSLRIDGSTFQGLTSLRSLTLDGNWLYEVENGTFNGTVLPKLQHLSLANCRIYETGQLAFDNLTSLTSVNMSHNRMTKVIRLTNSKNLYIIDLSYNRIQDLTDLPFDGLEKTVILRLNHNQLTSLPANALKGLGNLRNLLLSYNQLAAVSDAAFDHTNSLGVLSLDHNQLQNLTLQPAVLGRMERLEVNHNRWHCDCHTGWMRDNQLIKTYNPADQMICSSPADVAGMTMTSVDEHHFDCDDHHHGLHSNTVALAFGVAFAVLIVTGLSVMLYRHVRKSRVRRQLHRSNQPTSVYNRVNGSQEIIVNADKW